MITHDLASAQILLILVSDNRRQIQEMTRDMQASRFRYFFALHAARADLLESVTRRLIGNDGRLPAVLVIHHTFAEKDCAALLDVARGIGACAAIACVVTHPPMRESRRHLLRGLGARLFDRDDSAALGELVLH